MPNTRLKERLQSYLDARSRGEPGWKFDYELPWVRESGHAYLISLYSGMLDYLIGIVGIAYIQKLLIEDGKRSDPDA